MPKIPATVCVCVSLCVDGGEDLALLKFTSCRLFGDDYSVERKDEIHLKLNKKMEQEGEKEILSTVKAAH